MINNIEENMENKVNCKLYNLEGIVYLIPLEKVEDFESIPYYEKEKSFEIYILPDECVIEEVLIDQSDYENMLEGWF